MIIMYSFNKTSRHVHVVYVLSYIREKKTLIYTIPAGNLTTLLPFAKLKM
jgi:hypothetical protein